MVTEITDKIKTKSTYLLPCTDSNVMCSAHCCLHQKSRKVVLFYILEFLAFDIFSVIQMNRHNSWPSDDITICNVVWLWFTIKDICLKSAINYVTCAQTRTRALIFATRALIRTTDALNSALHCSCERRLVTVRYSRLNNLLDPARIWAHSSTDTPRIRGRAQSPYLTLSSKSPDFPL